MEEKAEAQRDEVTQLRSWVLGSQHNPVRVCVGVQGTGPEGALPLCLLLSRSVYAELAVFGSS